MINLRQSAISDYETCPFVYLNNYGDIGVPDAPYNPEGEYTNKYAATGIALHEAMEYWGLEVIAGRKCTILQLHDKLDERYKLIPEKLFKNKLEHTMYYDSLHEQIEWLYTKSNGITPLAVEHNFRHLNMIPNVDIPMIGTIDRIEGIIENKEVDLVDYKTGKAYTKKELLDNVQATIYSLAFYKENGFLPKRFIFLFSKVKKIMTIYVTNDFIERGIERIIPTWAHILNKDFKPDNSHSFFCNNFCEFKKICPLEGRKKQGWANVCFEPFTPNED